MPKIGEIGINKCKHIWQACAECGRERWVRLAHNQPLYFLCHHCACITDSRRRNMSIAKKGLFCGEQSPNWRGGKHKTLAGYFYVLLDSKDKFFRPMANNGNYILEHRFIMAKHLGRNLQSWEKVHHKNGIKGDNRIENLELTTPSQHIADHNKGYKDGFQKGYNDGKDKIILELKTKIKLLEAQIE